MSLSNLRENVTSAMDTLKDGFQQVETFVANNPIATAVGGSAAVLGGGLAIASLVKRKKRKKKTKHKYSRKKSRSTRKRSRRTPRTAGKGKDRSSKRIRYTKKGQPYIIKSDGRARFIKMSSASQSHKRKGGRY